MIILRSRNVEQHRQLGKQAARGRGGGISRPESVRGPPNLFFFIMMLSAAGRAATWRRMKVGRGEA
jgi:hypothetical protein